MQETSTGFGIFSTITKFMKDDKGASTLKTSMMCALHIMYGLHKKYSAKKGDNETVVFEYDVDELADNLLDAARQEPGFHHLYNLYLSLSTLKAKDFNDSYVESLQLLVTLYNVININKRSEHFDQLGVSRLMSLFIKDSECRTVYDPFCGSAFIAQYLNNINFIGQDADVISTILAKLNLDANLQDASNITCCDSINNWNKNQFDAVASVPPFGHLVNRRGSDILRSEFSQNIHTLEDIFYRRAFECNQANCVISLEPLSFCYSNDYYSVRKYLIENNYLDTIISFPSKLVYYTSVPCVMVICKKFRKQNTISFYDGKEYTEEKDGLLLFSPDDAELLYKDIESHNAPVNIAVKSQLKEFGYNLYPALYSWESTAHERGQQVVHLGDILTKVKPIQSDSATLGIIRPGRLSRDFMEILRNKKRILPKVEQSAIKKQKRYSGKNKGTLLLCLGRTLADVKFALYSGKEDFICDSSIQVYEINHNLVEDDYFVYKLLTNETLRKISMPIQSCKVVPVVLDSIQLQMQEMSSLKSELIQREKEEVEADRKRLGVKENISDLEHMLGTPQFKIDRIIDRLEDMTPNNANYSSTVKSLRDNFEYLNRVIKYYNTNMDSVSLNPVDCDISEFISSYAAAWANYGGEYFKLVINDKTNDGFVIQLDKDMMTVLLDAVLENAIRHGFNKKANFTENNLVEISLSPKKYKGNPYLLISIANNGKPFSKNFGLSEYISKGKYDADSGRSGLGGYHAYQITKKHHGFMYLDSTRVWNVVLDILLPLNNDDITNLTEYDHECV